MQQVPTLELPHGRNDCTTLDPVTLLDETLVIMTVGTQVFLVVLDNNQLPVSDQAIAAIDHFTIFCGCDLRGAIASNFYATPRWIGG